MPFLSFRRAAATAVATGALVGARRFSAERADRRFMHIDPRAFTVHEVGTDRFRLPAAYHRSDGLVAYLAADLDAIAQRIPSSRLFPVRLDRTRALVAVMGMRHLEVASTDPNGATVMLTPYGELAVVALVTRRSMPPLAPVLLEWALDRPMAALVLQLPVTSRGSRDAGRAIWGMPKFLADLEFADEGASRSVHAAEGGRTILDLRLEIHGSARFSRASSILYTVRDGRLIETTMPSHVFAQSGFRPNGALELGDHPIADELRDLGLATWPSMGGIIQQQRFLLPAGRDIGPADAATPVARYAGSDAEYARFTTRYPDGTLVDHAAAAMGTPRTRAARA